MTNPREPSEAQQNHDYHVYPCTDAEQLFYSVVNSQSQGSGNPARAGIFTQSLQLDLAGSRFSDQPCLLFQNNALGEWFKVRLARHQGVSIGLAMRHSQEVLEHYLSYFFPSEKQTALAEGSENWIHPDIISLLLFRLFQGLPHSTEAQSRYLPKALVETLQLLGKQLPDPQNVPGESKREGPQAREVRQQHLWGLARNLGQLFFQYDNYRDELGEALELRKNPSAEPAAVSAKVLEPSAENEAPRAESWQRNLWHHIQQQTSRGFYWHGRLISRVLNESLRPCDTAGRALQPEPLYIIGSGFLSARQLSFYSYLAQFTAVHHFWLTPARFPADLRRECAQILQGEGNRSDKRVRSRKEYERRIRQLSERVGGLPQFLWLENSLHSAALLSLPGKSSANVPADARAAGRDLTAPVQRWAQWHQEDEMLKAGAGKAGSPGLPAPSRSKPGLLALVQQQLRLCTGQSVPQKQQEQRNRGGAQAAPDADELPGASVADDKLLRDGSIQYFACSDKRREVEVLKDQILASLDAHPDWQLSDIAVLAPDINQYQSLIQSIFQNSARDYCLNCNFIDLRKNFGASGVPGGPTASSAGALSEYFTAFATLLGFAQNFTAGARGRFRLDDCLQFLENPCSRAADLLKSKPGSFWRKVFRHWRLSWGMHRQHRLQSQVRAVSGPQPAAGSELGTWQGALELFVRDYLSDYGGVNASVQGVLTPDVPNVSDSFGLDGLRQQMSLAQDEARLLAEVLQVVLRLYQCLSPMAEQRGTISEWVARLEGLQDEFLLCRSEDHYSDQRDRSAINTALRNFLAMEESLLCGLSGPPGADPPSSEPFAAHLVTEGKIPDSGTATGGGAADQGNQAARQQLRFPFTVIQDLLRQKLEQNFGFKGRYLTQGITCSSLQPYRSVPFRMICVLGLNEKDFPRGSAPLRFDLLAQLPQHLSLQTQEQHIFAELLISARQRLLLFYQNRDLSKGTEQNPSASLHELAYFIAKLLRQDEESVWRALEQRHPLFPFDSSYFAGDGPLFSYSRSAWEQYQAWQSSQKIPEPSDPVPLSAPHRPESLLRIQFCDLLELFYDAPSYFWQHYSGLDPRTAPESWQGREELPLFEQFGLGNDVFLAQSLAPMKVAKWLCQLWGEIELLLPLLSEFSGADHTRLRHFLEAEGLLGAELFRDMQWRSFAAGLNAIRFEMESKLLREGLWPGWQDFVHRRCYSLLLQGEQDEQIGQSEQVAQGKMEQPGLAEGRLLLIDSQNGAYARGAFLLPALRLQPDPDPGAPGSRAEQSPGALLEADVQRLWFYQERLLCWNKSPFGVAPQLYNLLQQKLFVALRQTFPQRLGRLTELLQIEWTYHNGLLVKHSKPGRPMEGEQLAESEGTLGQSLEDYIWLLWRARCEPLPLTAGFLEFLAGSGAKLLRTALAEYSDAARQSDRSLAELQQMLRRQWQQYIQGLEQTGASTPSAAQVGEGLYHLPICFDGTTLQNPRFWSLLNEVLEAVAVQ